MARTKMLNAALRLVDDDRIQVQSGDDWRKNMMVIFLGLTGIGLVVISFSLIRSDDFLQEFLHGENRTFTWLLLFMPLVFLVLWLVGPRSELFLERDTKTVRFRSKKMEFSIPWDQIRISRHWTMVKAGRIEWISLRGTPPFPDLVQGKVGKNPPFQSGNTGELFLGSIMVASSEQGEAIRNFLDTWMQTRQPAEALYESLVQRKLGE